MKAVMISIKPQYVAKILNGEKTIEIRKTMPKCELPIDVYIYCTKGNEILYGENSPFIENYINYFASKYYDENNEEDITGELNGKVIAKFTLNKIRTSDMTNCLQGSCLSYDEVNEYTKDKNFYSWVIDNLVIFDRPKELSEFRKLNTPTYEQTKPFAEMFGDKYTKEEYLEQCKKFGFLITKAPQSWCYVEVDE